MINMHQPLIGSATPKLKDAIPNKTSYFGFKMTIHDSEQAPKNELKIESLPYSGYSEDLREMENKEAISLSVPQAF